MSFLAELLDFRLFLVAALVFIPLERLFAERKGQKLLPRRLDATISSMCS